MSRRIIVDELEIDVPYGKLKAKTWHEETDDCKRVLALHGWMDNAGSFDNLLPHLKHKDGLYVVGLDLPGHGRSSQLPPGSKYDDMTFVVEMRRLILYLKWNQDKEKGEKRRKFSILGHSLGAGIGLFYASLYPDEVEEIVMIDLLKGKTRPTDEMLQNIALTMDDFLQLTSISSNNQTPAQSSGSSSSHRQDDSSNGADNKGQVIVSQETAIVATIEAHRPLGVLTRNGALCLLKRSTVAVSSPPNSVVYSRDLRLKSIIQMREHWDVVKVIFEGLKCHVFSILAKEGVCQTDPLIKDHLDDMIDYVGRKAKSFHLEWAEGDHFLHLSKPEAIASSINQFLNSPSDYKAKQ